MSNVVDTIVAEIILQGTEKYEANMARIIASHRKLIDSTSLISAGQQQYQSMHDRSGAALVQSEQSTADKVTRVRKKRAQDTVASDEAEVKSAKRAADARIAEAERVAEREARLDASARRRNIATYGDNPGMRRATGGRIGATVANEPHGQASIPASVLNGAGAETNVAEAEQVNRLAADLITYRANLVGLAGKEKLQVQDMIAEMQLEKRLLAENVAEEEILLRIEERRTLVAAKRAADTKAQNTKALTRGLEQGARGAGAYAAIGGPAAIGGLVAAGAVAGIVDLTKEGLRYAQSLKVVSDQLGITTADLQRYQAVGNTLGVTQEQLRESLGQFSNNLGRAQEGSEQQSKIFAALNIDIGNSTTGFKSLSDILPTFLDRLSKIPSQAQRLAIETALGGEQLRKLDPVISRGADGFDQLANSIAGTSDMLSDKQIQDAAATANKLKLLGDQLERDLTSTIASNAKEIEALANSFFKLAGYAIQAFNAMQRFGANNIINSPFASDEDRKFARGFLNSTPAGRKQALDSNTAALAQLGHISDKPTSFLSFGAPRAFEVIPGVGQVNNNPQAIAAARRQLQAQRAEIIAANKADAAADAPKPVQSGNPNDVSHLFSPKPKKGRKGKSATTLENEEEARNKRFEDQLASFQEAQLRAEEEATGDIQRRADIEKRLADRALARELGDIEATKRTNIRNGENPAKAEQQARALAAAAKQAHDQQIANIEASKQVQLAQATTAHLSTALQIQSDLLGYQLAIATTAKERKAIELRLLDIAIQQERAALERDRAGLKPGDPGIADIDARIAALGAKRDAQAAVINRNDAGPLQDYINRLPHTADQIREAFETAAVSGVERLNDSLATTLSNLLHIHGAAGELLNDLIKIGLQYLEFQASKGGSGGGFFASIANAAASAFGGGGGGLDAAASLAPGFATGGSFRIGGNPGIDRNTLSINGKVRARVGANETIAVIPDVAASNRAITPAGGVTVIAPRHYDLSNAVIDRDTLAQMNAENRDYARQVAQQAGAAAYHGALGAAPAQMQKLQDLGN